MARKVKQLSYSQALRELEQITREIESDQIDIDALGEKVKRAVSLITFCRTRLREAEEEVGKVLEEMETDARGPSFPEDPSEKGSLL